MIRGNEAILHHKTSGRSLRLFKGARAQVTYLGEFEIDDSSPWYQTDAPETGDGPIRQVIVFRLRPKGEVVRSPEDELPSVTSGVRVSAVPLEAKNVEKYLLSPRNAVTESERREHTLVCEYSRHLASRDVELGRHRYEPGGEAKPLYCDAFEEQRKNLVEAKGSCARESIRMALGQVLDYARFEPAGTARAALLPARPRPDLESLLACAGISVIWRDASGHFLDNADGRFT